MKKILLKILLFFLAGVLAASFCTLVFYYTNNGYILLGSSICLISLIVIALSFFKRFNIDNPLVRTSFILIFIVGLFFIIFNWGNRSELIDELWLNKSGDVDVYVAKYNMSDQILDNSKKYYFELQIEGEFFKIFDESSWFLKIEGPGINQDESFSTYDELYAFLSQAPNPGPREDLVSTFYKKIDIKDLRAGDYVFTLKPGTSFGGIYNVKIFFYRYR